GAGAVDAALPEGDPERRHAGGNAAAGARGAARGRPGGREPVAASWAAPAYAVRYNTRMDIDAALQLLARDPAAPLDLAELALGLARDEYPDLDVEAYLSEI